MNVNQLPEGEIGRIRAYIIGACCKYKIQRDDSEDIAQDILVKMLSTPVEKVNQFLSVTISNKVADFYRNQKRKSTTVLDPEMASKRLTDDLEPLPEFALSPRRAEILKLREDGFEMKEIAAIVGRSYGSVRMDAVRLRQDVTKQVREQNESHA